jgi:hypothetical protein
MEDYNLVSVAEPDNEVRDLQLFNAEKMTHADKLKITAELLGYREMPQTWDTFLSDKYYMGDIAENLYPFWKEKGNVVFPDPIHTRYPFLVFTGAIGTGKSTFVRFLAEYMKHRICCLKDPYKTFGFVPGKYLKFSYFHKTGALAQSDFLDVLNSWEELSPYFSELHANGSHLDLIEQVCDSVRSNNNIGSDVIFYNMSELNFINFDSAHEKLDMALKRFNSRFDRIRRYFGLVIIDTSAQGDDSIADDFIKNNPYGDDVYAIYTNQWLVREHMHWYGRAGWFKVFTGDGTHQPFIIKPEAGKVVTPDMDQDRVIDVPEEMRGDFEFDLITALQDKAGISVSATDRFFPDTTNLKKCFDLPQYGPDVVKFDFYDKTDKLIYRFNKSIESIPRDKIIFIRYDIGVTGDNCGLAIAYFDKWYVLKDLAAADKFSSPREVRFPIIDIPLAVGINRYEGTETPISHLFEFIMDLNDIFEIGCFTADQFASRQLLQDLKREGVTNQYLSVDRTDEAYVYTKSLANRGLLHMPSNVLLETEFCQLRRVGNKIDHPATGSKDIADSVSGAVYNLYQNIDKAGQLSVKYKVNQYAKQIEDRTSQGKDLTTFQDMMQSIYGS